jgi:hypothetical protein
VALGVFGGGIVSAVKLYAAFGWTATWIEIGAWGPLQQPAPIRIEAGNRPAPI